MQVLGLFSRLFHCLLLVGLITVIAACGDVLDSKGSSESSGAANARNLWEGEEIRTAQGFPFLARYFEADKDGPLVVLIPGAFSLARVYYGGEGSEKTDFVTHWLNKKGYNVLALSYPVVTANPVFDKAYPGITVRAWGRGAAEITKSIMDENKLTGEVIVGVWSMGGKSVQPFAEAAEELGLDLGFHVAFASTPAIPTSAYLARPFEMHETGMINRDAGAIAAKKQLGELAEYNDREMPIIPHKSLVSDYTGFSPVNLLGGGMRYDKETHSFVTDVWGVMQDTKFYEVNFPLVAVIAPTWQMDARHVLTDHATWGYHNANTIFYNLVGGTAEGRKLSREQIQAVRDLSRASYEDLVIDVEGNHFFFIGEKGARATADAIEIFKQRIAKLKKEIREVLSEV